MVEDNPSDIVLLGSMLRRAFDGLELVPVQTLAAAMEALAHGDFDVVLLDLGLPDARGLEVVSRVQAHSSALPILVLTGIDDDSLGFLALRAGAQEFLPKRLLDPLLLERAIRHAVERAGLRAELARQHHRARSLAQRVAKADRLAAIGRIAAGIAHEINNPATYVSSNLEFLANALEALEGLPNAPALRQATKECIEGFGRITAITRDLHSFTRTDDSEIVSTDLNDVVEVACRMLRSRLRSGVEVVCTLDPRVPKIPTHAGRLTQVAVNLITNALDAMEVEPSRPSRLHVQTCHDADSVHLIVDDNGCGIDHDDRGRIFEAFFTTKGKRGTGLGLSLCREIVEAHHGALTIDTTPSQGTRVRVQIPRRTGLTPTSEFPAIDDSQVAKPTPIRTLLVDDEPLIRRSLGLVLAGLGEVEVAADGRQALELIQSRGPFHVVFCDLSMPETDGQWLYRELREHAPQYLSRLVFLTGGIFEQRLNHFVAHHDLRVLAKPVRRRDLVTAIEGVAPTEACP